MNAIVLETCRTDHELVLPYEGKWYDGIYYSTLEYEKMIYQLQHNNKLSSKTLLKNQYELINTTKNNNINHEGVKKTLEETNSYRISVSD